MGLLLLWGQLLAIAAGHFDPGNTLRELGYEMVELRRTSDNHLFLFGNVEGRRRSCLVDTGWSFTTVSTNTAARLSETNRIHQLTLGRVVLADEPVLVQDLRANGQPTSYDVVLGCDFLLRHHAVTDVAGRRLFLRAAELSAPKQAQLALTLSQGGLVEIAMKRREPWALTCQAEVQGRPVELLVDSGAAWSCLDLAVARDLKLHVVPTLNRIMGPAAAKRRNFAVADLKSWRLGGQAMPETSVAVFSLTEWGLGPTGKLFDDVGGILGGSELFARCAVIDCGAAKLWLRTQR